MTLASVAGVRRWVVCLAALVGVLRCWCDRRLALSRPLQLLREAGGGLGCRVEGVFRVCAVDMCYCYKTFDIRKLMFSISTNCDIF